MANIGCVINKTFKRPDKALIEKFRGVPVANIDDVVNGMSALPSSLRPVNSVPLLGPAFTVRVPAGDNLMYHKAMDLAEPGDIIVIDAGGYTERAIVGELMSTYCMERGVAGIVVYGAIRDKEPLEHLPFPVYYVATTPNGPYQNGPGEINTTISIGGVIIRPGDILTGDGDGVLVIQPEHAEEILQNAKKVGEHEDHLFADIRSTKKWERPFVDERLAAIHCEINE
jgi:RraA family protein